MGEHTPGWYIVTTLLFDEIPVDFVMKFDGINWYHRLFEEECYILKPTDKVGLFIDYLD